MSTSKAPETLYEGVFSSDYEFNETRTCSDCRHLRGAVSWWCTNAEACARRGTSMPTEADCLQWKPARRVSDLSWFERWFSSKILHIPADAHRIPSDAHRE